MSSQTTFTRLKLLPELFPLVASHLPLYATPSTLLSLALTNHEIYDIVHNLLYSRLILRNEKDAISTIQRILTNPELGKAVRELHIMSELTVATMDGETAFDTVTGLRMLVRIKALPYLHTLVLHLLEERLCKGNWCRIKGFGHLPADFWEDLHNNCPRVRTIVLSGIGDQMNDPWLDDSEIYELKGMEELTHFGLTFCHGGQVHFDGKDRLIKNLCNISSSLHTLVLGFYHKYDLATPILCLDFPRLRSLTLELFIVPDTSEAMAFWRRHPLIEKLKLKDTQRISRWFDDKIEDDLLPNLKYLQASFGDVRSLIPILPSLTGLSIQQSLNAQVPYLLRCLIPEGLPNLASLEIDQECSSDRNFIDRYTGSLWYETLDGKFHEETIVENAARRFTDDYIHSIAKGAPNLKELCLHGIALDPLIVQTKLAPQLAGFTKLERLYYRGVTHNALDLQTLRAYQAHFTTSARAIAEICKTLESITDISILPYSTAKIRRNQAGEVIEAVHTEGYGMIIGSEDEAFPTNPRPFGSL